MPRIEAANIEEHVRLQTGRILTAATQLFRDLGYRGTDMEDIAQAVGLARNSLYRYYPNKDHILLACVLRDMVPFVEELQSL
jgi:AcrR family transcriptional regulator